MAILQGVPGISFTVQVAGRDAIEYEDPNALEQESARPAGCPVSTKYIECIDGAEFSIKGSITEDHHWGYKDHCLEARISVDGEYLRGWVLGEREVIRGYGTKVFEGRKAYCSRTGGWVLQRCQFSAITTVDDSKKDRVERDVKVAKDLGLIEIEVSRCIYLGNSPTVHRSPPKKSRELELAEKSLKGRAMSHGTSFPKSELTHAPTHCHTRKLAEDHGPIAVFRFYYRSKDALKREMAIPRTPSPSPVPKQEISNMSRAELERLAQERLNQLRGGGDVKQERKPIIKRERKEIIDLSDGNARPVKLPRRSLKQEGEVIDLTGD
ncbi:hypothetical protein F5Y05DRAFT_407760 [Hypoxylon sp. FL0543]|nr:hypothetical protein F5Y05DRAFT_407760 [Hypoxylon sp. FL0543]